MVLGCALLGFAAYLPAMQGAFLMSDQRMLVENPRLTDLAGLASLWSPFPIGAYPPLDQYQPLSYTALWLERQLWGLHAVAYQVVSVLLHGLNAWLVLRILRRVGARGAAVAAAVFALHPVQVESVVWIYEQKNVLSGAFFFAALLAWLRYREERRETAYALALVAFAAALLAKASTVVLPALILLYAWYRGDAWRWSLARTAPFFALAAGMAGLTVWYETGVVGAGGEAWAAAPLERLLRAGWVLVLHAEKLLLPTRLAFFYPQVATDPSDPVAWLPDLGLLALFAALWSRRRGWGRPALLGLGYYVVAMAPVLGFFDIYYHQFSLIADHFQYLALLGPAALAVHAAATGLGRLPRPAAAARAAAVALVAACWLLSWGRSHVFASELSLARDAARRYPDSWLARAKSGEFLLAAVMQEPGGSEASLAQAIADLERALALRPDDPSVHNSLGVAYALQGRPEAARRHMQRSVAAVPANPEFRRNLAALLESSFDPEEALAEYRVLVELAPRRPAERLLLARALLRAGRPPAALREIDVAIGQLEPAAATNPGAAEQLRRAHDLRFDALRAARAAAAEATR